LGKAHVTALLLLKEVLWQRPFPRIHLISCLVWYLKRGV